MGPDRPQDSFCLFLKPNRRFSTHFGLSLMFWDRTQILNNQDWTWADFGRPLAEAWAHLGTTWGRSWGNLGPTLERPWADLWLTWGRLLDGLSLHIFKHFLEMPTIT